MIDEGFFHFIREQGFIESSMLGPDNGGLINKLKRIFLWIAFMKIKSGAFVAKLNCEHCHKPWEASIFPSDSISSQVWFWIDEDSA